MTASILARVELAPGDPILGVNEAYNADPNPNKVNLVVGIYFDDEAQSRCSSACAGPSGDMLETLTAPSPTCRSRDRRRTTGGAGTAVRRRPRGASRSGRIATMQTLGGTGGLKVGADFIKRWLPERQVWISDPSWDNHRAMFEGAGIAVHTYPYYDAATGGLDFDAMLASAAHAAGAAASCCCTPAATTRPAST